MKFFNGFFAIGLFFGVLITLFIGFFAIGPCPPEEASLWFCREEQAVILQVLKLLGGFSSAAMWPMLFGILVWIFRNEIRSLIPNVTSIGPAGVEMSVAINRQKNTKPAEPILDKLANQESRQGKLANLEKQRRTPLIGTLEENLHENFKNIPEAMRLDEVVYELAIAKLDVEFWATYFRIFGSQIRLLRKIKANGKKISVTSANNYFREVQSQHPVFENSQTSDYLKFLELRAVISSDKNWVSLTETGDDFLLFLHRASLSDEKEL